jgi:hypothetical protein
MDGWTGLVLAQFRRIQRDFERVLIDLDPALLDRSPQPGANTIGWLAWHLTRSHDRNVAELAGVPQLWVAQGWVARFGRVPNSAETGYGHTPQQLSEFRSPDPAVLIDYHRAVVDMVVAYLRTGDDLDRVTHSPTLGYSRTVGPSLVGVLSEGFQHVGQMAYLRGLYAAT